MQKTQVGTLGYVCLGFSWKQVGLFLLFLPDIVAQLTEKTINLLKNKFTGLGLEEQLVKDV